MEKIGMIHDLIKEYEVKTGVTFTGNLKLNGRLSRSLGRCVSVVRENVKTKEILSVEPKTIELNKQFFKIASKDELRKVVAHEYAHYCTIKKVGLHNHDTKEFKDYCKLLNTSHKAEMNTEYEVKSKYDIYCSCCNKLLGSRSTSRADVVKHSEFYRSPCCEANLKVVKNY